jgi:hypothetical protein
MAYSAKLDKELFGANIPSDDGTVLRVSVYSYNGGDAKLQIGPRVFTKKNGEEGFRKAGRISGDELEKLIDLMPELSTYLVDKAVITG